MGTVQIDVMTIVKAVYKGLNKLWQVSAGVLSFCYQVIFSWIPRISLYSLFHLSHLLSSINTKCGGWVIISICVSKTKHLAFAHQDYWWTGVQIVRNKNNVSQAKKFYLWSWNLTFLYYVHGAILPTLLLCSLLTFFHVKH